MVKKILFILAILLVIGCAQEIKENAVKEVSEMRLTSPAFKDNAMIPSKYTCQGDDVNPQLNIEGIPSEAKSLVLIVDDPDAPGGMWVHWVVWNIPVVFRIEEDSVPGEQGLNDFGKQDYGGPCPPSGTHRYMFKIYALDTTLELDNDSDKKDVERAMQGHILTQAKLTGLYSKR